MRAATTLLPMLQAAGSGAIADLWRGDEWVPSETSQDCTSSGFETLDRELPGGGWPHGQLIELLVDQPGIGELGLLLPSLATATRGGRSCVWVLPCQASGPGAGDSSAAAMHALPYAPALAEAGIELARNIFVRPLTPRESGWALEQSLRTAHLGALLGWFPAGAGDDADFRALRRLHLLAQRHRALVFLLRTARHAQAPSPAALRLHLQSSNGCLQVQLLKRRGRPLMEPLALQIHPARWNRTPAAQPETAPRTHIRAKTVSSLAQVIQAISPRTPWPSRALSW